VNILFNLNNFGFNWRRLDKRATMIIKDSRIWKSIC